MSRILLSFCMALLVASAYAADTRLEVFELKHRPAEQMVPVVQPLLQEDEVVQAHGFQLVVRARSGTIDQVRALLERLDQAPKRLLIRVRHSTSTRTVQEGADADVHAGPEGIGADVRIYGTNERDQGAADQQIQVVEGSPAFIAFGQSVPVGERTLIIDRHSGTVQDSVQYRDVSSGFYVLPQVSGDRIRLRVSPHRDTLSRAGGGVVNVQRADTLIEGPIGEWIELGGTVEQSNSAGSGTVYRTRERSEQTGRITVKVDVLQ